MHNTILSNIIRPIFRFLNRPLKWVKGNKTLAQTYTNILSTIVTLAALLFTIYFSVKALNESHTSNKNAERQLKLSEVQYNLSKSEFDRSKLKESNDSLQQLLKDKDSKLTKHFDSIRQAKNDLFQVASFQQQQGINKQQLKAITKQANTAEAQFNLQSIQNADLYERNKAVFSPDTVTIQDLNATSAIVSFRIVNSGNTWAHIDSTYFAVYNPKYLYFNHSISLSNADLGQSSKYKTAGVDVFRSYIGLDNIYYCLIIYYYDTADKKEKAIPKFFRYTYDSKKMFILLPVPSEVINDFYKEILSHRNLIKH